MPLYIELWSPVEVLIFNTVTANMSRTKLYTKKVMDKHGGVPFPRTFDTWRFVNVKNSEWNETCYGHVCDEIKDGETKGFPAFQ